MENNALSGEYLTLSFFNAYDMIIVKTRNCNNIQRLKVKDIRKSLRSNSDFVLKVHQKMTPKMGIVLMMVAILNTIR